MKPKNSVLILLTLIILSVIGLWYWAWIPADISNMDCGLSHNAAWISVDWTSEPIDEVAVKQLALDASERKLHYLYPFTTYVKKEGEFSPSYDYSADFVSTFRQYNQETKVLAWVGVPLQPNNGFGVPGWTNLAHQEERDHIVKFVSNLIQERDFDGVHLNVETVWDNDPHYLKFLEEMRQALGSDYTLSIASHAWLPSQINKLASDLRWSGVYYQAVARRVDQIVTMTYDSRTPTAIMYRLWMREQVRGISNSLVESETELLIGISISREDTGTHDPTVENLSNGLAGLCSALVNLKGQPVNGVAIYAAWEADDTDWQIWEGWLH